MKLTNFISFGAALAMAVAPIAAAQAQSAVASSGYLVVREGKVVSVQTDSALVTGDRVVTRGSQGTTLALNGCSLAVPAASTVTIDANACASTVKSLQVARAGAPMESANSLRGAGWLVALLALAAVIAGALIAAKGGNQPTSP
jgi:hypothetical protein